MGDSLNQVIAGQETTLSATLDQMIYHAAAVRRGAPRPLLFVDLPFLTYQVIGGRGDPERRPGAAGDRRRTGSSSRAAGRWPRRCARWWTGASR